MRFQDIPQLTKTSNYSITVSWDFIEGTLENFSEGDRGYVFDMDTAASLQELIARCPECREAMARHELDFHHTHHHIHQC